MTKNITLSVDEDILDRFRVVAAKEKKTVSALVREFMESRANEDARAAARRTAARRMLELSRKSSAKVDKNWTFDREEIYAGRISRHQHNNLRGGRGEK